MKMRISKIGETQKSNAQKKMEEIKFGRKGGAGTSGTVAPDDLLRRIWRAAQEHEERLPNPPNSEISGRNWPKMKEWKGGGGS